MERKWADIRTRFYLDTSAIYSLANKLEEIARYDNVAISMLGIQEIISAIYNKSNFQRSKAVISKIRSSNLHIYPYLPLECVAMAFELDIEKLEFVINKKEQIWHRATILSESTSYEEYEQKLKRIGININTILNDEKEVEELNHAKFYKIVDDGRKVMRETKTNQKKTPQFYELKIDDLVFDTSKKSLEKSKKERIRPTLVDFLDNCMIAYDEEYINSLCEKYNGELTAFLLGNSFYNFKRAYKGEQVRKNDYIDLEHLLYLRSENDIIVSDDKLFNTSTIFQQRKTVDEFRRIFKIL